jgi:methylglyoxal synthase
VNPGLLEKLPIALIARGARKGEFAAWAEDRRTQRARCTLIATGNTGLQVLEPFGGDRQIGARIAEGRADAPVFFIDSWSVMSHDVGVKQQTRIAVLKNIQFALTRATVNCIVPCSQLIAEGRP